MMEKKYQISDLIEFISKLPSIGGRSAKKIAISMIKDKKNLMNGFAHMLTNLSGSVQECMECRNIDTSEVCNICKTRVNAKELCIVTDIDDIWNIEKSDAFFGIYYVLKGHLSTTNSVRPEDLNISRLCQIIKTKEIQEVIFALGSTMSAQTTYYYVLEEIERFCHLNGLEVKCTSLAFGIPMGSDIDYLDEGTISQSFLSRK